MDKEGHIFYIDVIRFVATFSVVWLHSAAPILYRFNKIPISYWWVGNIYDSMARMAVPLFFMISGVLLLQKTETLKNFFKKRIRKVLIPLMAWTIIYIFWKAYVEKTSFITFQLLYSTLLSPVYYHMWFLYAILGLYLYIPILRIFFQNSTTRNLYYFVLLWIVAVSLLPYIEDATGCASRIDLKMISGFGGYLIIGGLLGKISNDRKTFVNSIIGFVICVVITAYGTFYLTSKNGLFVKFFYDYLSLNVIFLSVTTFILIKYMAQYSVFHSEKMISIMKLLSSVSFGIYLIHPIFIYLLKIGAFGFKLDVLYINPLYSVPLIAFLTFLLSFFSVILLKKVPILRSIVP